MADYTVNIGGNATMMIRDTGGWVEFWFKAGSQTWNNQQTYSFGANGSGSGVRQFRLLRGGNWHHVDSVWIGYDQTISFTIYDTGLAFPGYTQFQHIQRTTVPQAPTLNSVTPISFSGFRVIHTTHYDGGSGIVERQLGYGSSTNGPNFLTPIFDGDEIVGGFTTGQTFYFWVRVRNALGWSPWSNRIQATTHQVPPAPGQATFVDVTQVSVGVNFPFNKRANDPPNLEKQFKYGRDPTGAVIDATVNADQTIEYLTNLDPGKTYYFWARTRNAVGWGPWTPNYSRLILVAGARVLDGGTWRRAIPYVNVGGTWKVAEPWIKNAGTWKRTSL